MADAVSTRRALKRANRNCPQQLPTKRAVSSFRVAPGLNAGTAKADSRDPRFDAISKGNFEEHTWRSKYDFVFEQQKQELQQLKQTLARSKKAEKSRAKASRSKQRRLRKKIIAPEEADALRLEINQKTNQVHLYDQAVAKQRAKSAIRKKEVEAIQKGKKPFFHKQKEVRKMELVERYEQLETKGSLENFMAKKRKKQASKLRKSMPHARHSADAA
mmetsp:Transcript_67822/g.112753  ORF Transcript_67822/g.112753 Transcript_67822/m.112753 type:complete len:217 (-) Transcript_67822:282-932(-)